MPVDAMVVNATLPEGGPCTRTFERFKELMRLLFPTLGYPTTPTVMLWALGLYALSSRSSAGAVDEERFER